MKMMREREMKMMREMKRKRDNSQYRCNGVKKLFE